MTILLTGGTGTLGRHVLPLLSASGRRVRVLSRHEHAPADGVEYVTGDLLSGKEIDDATAGTEIILHLAGGPKRDDEAARAVARAAQRAGVRHLVAISVIGADRMPLGWFRTQRAVEEAIIGSGVPWTILRAAQFHTLVRTMLDKMVKLPVIPAPGGLRFEPVDPREVAARLASLTLGEPAGLVPDLPGPKVYELADLVRGYLKVRDKHRALLPIRMPGAAGRAYRSGENLSVSGQAGQRTWEEFVAESVLTSR
ncbi:SDR family oxidoreductase [Amycolatopsis sp. GM8]|uniref:SDR family oxidoreductase n=1 Tax=Amycolatopsis sp. GM8 TaxID=2896530 RepID=UPI001F42B187|nr:SDR family oxidoreductase [Amycolatopsis sp. GM8]